MRAVHGGAFSCLLAVSLAFAMQASGAAADDLLAGPTSAVRSAPPSSSPQSWLRAIATKDTLDKDPAMAATPTTCDKCQWQ